MLLTPRVDPLVADLQAQACGNSSAGAAGSAAAGAGVEEKAQSKDVQITMLKALGSVFTSSGSKVGVAAKQGASEAVLGLALGHAKEEVREAAAACLADIARHLTPAGKVHYYSSSSFREILYTTLLSFPLQSPNICTTTQPPPGGEAGEGDPLSSLVQQNLLAALLPSSSFASSYGGGWEPWCARHGAACALGLVALTTATSTTTAGAAPAAAAAAAEASGADGEGGGGAGLKLLPSMAQGLAQCVAGADGDNPLVATSSLQALARVFKASTRHQRLLSASGSAPSSGPTPLDALASDAKFLSVLARLCGPHSLGAADIRVHALHALKVCL